MSKVNKKQGREIEALAALKDRDIALSDLPEGAHWTGVVVGMFFRPIKKPVTVRLDADVIAWLKKQGKGNQTRINALLRAAMMGQGPRKRA